MRPEILFSYFSSVASLKGVGPKTVKKIETHIGPYIRDLLFFMPKSVTHRPLVKLSEATVGMVATLRVEVAGYRQASPKGPGRIECLCDGQYLSLVYFHYFKSMTEQHPIGAQRYVSGKIEKFGHGLQISHPDYLVSIDNIKEIPVFEPNYPACEGLSSKAIAKLVQSSIGQVPELNEWLDITFLNRSLWKSFNKSIEEIHTPKTDDIVSSMSAERSRLAYDEALAHQLAMKSRKHSRHTAKAIIIEGSSHSESMIKALPFDLTPSQLNALAEIRHDLASGFQMNRLLQGDVGSGKTIVALTIALDVISQGGQVVLMAPTEILAKQHFESAQNIFSALNLGLELLTGSDKGLKYNQKIDMISTGNTQFVIGTHALFQDRVSFKNLQLAIIDEQHRFGVEQRQRLFQKGANVHLLSMSATPIPRTMALTAYGDADLSSILDKPQGRQKIHTAVLPRDRLMDITQRLSAAVEVGSQAYWVCPVIEETEDQDLIAIEQRYNYLTRLFNNKVGLVHGRMSAIEKDRVIGQFIKQEIAILCATTVIEVGVNVPNASIMIIEQAERFGLAQLHQLRGRVGRGTKQSSCLLLYDNPLSKKAKKRLETLRDTEDGFIIAEMDWKMRGEGDLLGAKQSGLPDYVFIDLLAHQALIERASKEAEYLVMQWPRLEAKRRRALIELQHLFDWRTGTDRLAD